MTSITLTKYSEKKPRSISLPRQRKSERFVSKRAGRFEVPSVRRARGVRAAEGVGLQTEGGVSQPDCPLRRTYREGRMQLAALLLAYCKYDTIWAFCRCILTIISWGRGWVVVGGV